MINLKRNRMIIFFFVFYKEDNLCSRIRDIIAALNGIELKNKLMAFSHQLPVTSMIVMSSLKTLRKIHDKENKFLYNPNK